MKALRDNYDGYDDEKSRMNIMKEDLKELYFKCHNVFPLKKYVNKLKEAYNNLEKLNQPEFE